MLHYIAVAVFLVLLIKMSDKDEMTWKQAVIMMIVLSVLLIISEMFLFA
ncbi:hypothetical protein J1TS1_05400 [Shouchella clausii]|nr:hypothetical protein [Shouchella clausii]GIN06395.1 hypothetical protein J1TS1_05400 [Shouchella clausii]